MRPGNVLDYLNFKHSQQLINDLERTHLTQLKVSVNLLLLFNSYSLCNAVTWASSLAVRALAT